MDTRTLQQGSPIGASARSAGQETERAYCRHRAALRRYALGLTRDATAAEDLVHDAFIRLSVELQAGRAPDNVSAWLHRVVANLVASRARRLKVAVRNAERATPPEPTISAEAVVLDAELRRALGDALRTLSPVDRRVVLLAAHGFRGPEIATLVGRTDAATRTLLCRARSRLRARLTEWDAP